MDSVGLLSISKILFAKLVEHSFWQPRTPGSFREVRFKLGRIFKLSAAFAADLSGTRWFENRMLSRFANG